MIIQNRKTGKRFEVLDGTHFSRTAYFEVKKDGENKTVKVKTQAKTTKRKTNKKGTKKNG